MRGFFKRADFSCNCSWLHRQTAPACYKCAAGLLWCFPAHSHLWTVNVDDGVVFWECFHLLMLLSLHPRLQGSISFSFRQCNVDQECFVEDCNGYLFFPGSIFCWVFLPDERYSHFVPTEIGPFLVSVQAWVCPKWLFGCLDMYARLKYDQ